MTKAEAALLALRDLAATVRTVNGYLTDAGARVDVSPFFSEMGDDEYLRAWADQRLRCVRASMASALSHSPISASLPNCICRPLDPKNSASDFQRVRFVARRANA